MIYECPSCKIHSFDDCQPHTKISHPLCVFCSGKHTQKELLNWQFNHLNEIPAKHHPLILKHFYLYMDNELKNIYNKLEDIIRLVNDKKKT